MKSFARRRGAYLQFIHRIYILTYLLSRDINIPACTDIVIACENGLNTCSDPQRLNACVAQCCHAGDRGPNPTARTIFVVFLLFLFSLYIRSSLYSPYSVILNHPEFDSRFLRLFYCEAFTAGLSIIIAMYVTMYEM